MKSKNRRPSKWQIPEPVDWKLAVLAPNDPESPRPRGTSLERIERDEFELWKLEMTFQTGGLIKGREEDDIKRKNAKKAKKSRSQRSS
jgi:hypothetical protein